MGKRTSKAKAAASKKQSQEAVEPEETVWDVAQGHIAKLRSRGLWVEAGSESQVREGIAAFPADWNGSMMPPSPLD